MKKPIHYIIIFVGLYSYNLSISAEQQYTHLQNSISPDGKLMPTDSPPLNITGSLITDEPPRSLPKNSSFTGRIIDKQSRQPIPELTITAGQIYLKPDLNYQEKTDNNGNFQINNLTNNFSRIEISGNPNYGIQVIGIKHKYDKEYNFNVIELDKTCTVKGRLIDYDTGSPFPNIPVRAGNNGDKSRQNPFYVHYYLPTTVTDANGYFELSGVPAGHTRLEFHYDLNTNNSTNKSQARYFPYSLPIYPSPEKENAFTIPVSSHILRVFLDKNDRNQTVHLLNLKTDRYYSTTALYGDHCIFHNVFPGKYKVWINPNDGESDKNTITIEIPNAPSFDYHFNNPTKRLAGTAVLIPNKKLKYPNGTKPKYYESIEFGKLLVKGISDTTKDYQTTVSLEETRGEDARQSDSPTTLKNLPAGKYQVSGFSPNNGILNPVMFTVTDSQITSVPIEFTPTKMGNLSITAHDKTTGKTIEDFDANLITSDGIYYFCMREGDGEVKNKKTTINNLPVGKYKIEITTEQESQQRENSPVSTTTLVDVEIVPGKTINKAIAVTPNLPGEIKWRLVFFEIPAPGKYKFELVKIGKNNERQPIDSTIENHYCYTKGNLQPGTYEVTVSIPGYRSKSQSFEIRDPQPISDSPETVFTIDDVIDKSALYPTNQSGT